MSDPSSAVLIITAGIGFAGLLVTQVVIWDANRRAATKASGKTDQKIDDAAATAVDASDAAKLAAARALPVSNGFANEMRSGLSRIETGQIEIIAEVKDIRCKLDKHIMDHATASLLNGKAS